MTAVSPFVSIRSGVRAVPYAHADGARWDNFVTQSTMGTLLHTRAFLAYHGNRFDDRSLIFYDSSGKICAVLPAAVDLNDATCVVSHPGATYGGLILTTRKYGLDIFEILSVACAAFLEQGHLRCIYKSVPSHLHSGMQQVDLYALWRMRAKLYRRDLWNVIDLTQPRHIEECRLRRLRRSSEHGLRIVNDNSENAYAAFYAILVNNLAERHAVAPVHTLADMRKLHAIFPEHINLWVALDEDDACLAGEWIIDFGTAWHGQYGAATAVGRKWSAQDLLLNTLIEQSVKRGAKHFSFGTSTELDGSQLNSGLFKYKASFGCGSVVQDFYEIDLTSGPCGW